SMAYVYPPRELDDRLLAVAGAVDSSARWEARLELRDHPQPLPNLRGRAYQDGEEPANLSEELTRGLDSDDPAWGWLQVSDGPHGRDLKPEVVEPDELTLARRLAAAFLQDPPKDVLWLSRFVFRVATERALRFQPNTDLGESPPILAACGMTLAPESQADAGLKRLVAACPKSPAELLGLVLEQSPSSLATALTWCGDEIPESLVDRILSMLAGLLGSGEAGVSHKVHGTLGSLLCVASAEEQAWSWAVEQLVQGRWAVAPALFRHAPARAWAVTEGLLALDEAAVGLLSAVADVPEAWSRLEGQRATGILERLEELFGDALRPANERFNTENRLHERRREVLSALVDAGAFEALEAASQALRLSPLAVERARRARADTPMSLEEAARFERRLASSEDLLDRLMFALDQIQEDLGGPHSPYPGFFDRQHANRKEWRRKHETEACALLVYLLRQQLGDVRFDLEVQEYNGEDRIDITAAVSPRVRVKVEVKWDKNHPTEAVADQLERYLQGDAVPAGLLLVLMPPPRLALRGGPPQAVDEEALRTACAKLSNELGGRAVSPYVLTLGRSR
ncbi:MAG: hypothetical protein KC613_16225, partial [Myxococcales bacterium]|nr:hypothetical protein [Myxococcales bacterium]